MNLRSRRAFDGEEALRCARSCVMRRSWFGGGGRGHRHCRDFRSFRGHAWKSLVAVVGTKRFIADALHHSCVVILAPSTFRRMNLCFAGLVYDRLAEYKVRPILRKIMVLANILFLCGIPRAAWLHNRRLPTSFLPRLFLAMLYLFQCPENSFFPTWSTYQTKVANRSLKIVVNIIPEPNTRGAGLGRAKRGVG